MKIFIGLCGSNPDGFLSSGRGESRWALSLVRALHENKEHQIVMAPDTEPAGWGKCPKPDNVELLQAGELHHLKDEHFDLAIFTSWQDERLERKYINADKYLWGIMGWKYELMKDGYFDPNDYVIRWFRADVPEIPYPINFKDRCFLLAQPFGRSFEQSKFRNKRVAWVAKECFVGTTPDNLAESGARHLFATVDACKETGASLAIFSCHEFDPMKHPKIKKYGIMDKLRELDKVTFYPSLSFPEYQQELKKCSVTMPLAFAGSIQESIFNGLVPFMYRDCMFSNHPWIKEVCTDLTNNKISRFQSPEEEKDVLKTDEIKDIMVKLLSDKVFFEDYLCRLRPMVVDNLDSHVIDQLDKIMKHKAGGN